MKIVEHSESYEVRDSDGNALKHFHFKDEPGVGGRMTRKQAEQRAKAFVHTRMAAFARAMSADSVATPMPAARRFIRPWQVIEHHDSFEVTDGAGVGLAVVHFDDEPSRETMLKRLSKDEARRLAGKVARLPALLRIKKAIDHGEA
jgi:hypothetical protein